VRLILLDSRDNVAAAAENLVPGAVAMLGDTGIEILDAIPRGHKVALQPIPNGADVIRYGEVIGSTTVDVAIGQHVHVHNIVSKRLP